MTPRGRDDSRHGGPPSPEAVSEIVGPLVESAPNAMLVVDDAGEIVLVNGRAEILFGYSRHELLGARVSKLLPDLEREARIGDRFRDDLDLIGRRRDGSTFAAEISVSAITAVGRKLIAAVIRDATERRSFERRLRSMAEQDALTGLANRRQFEHNVREQISRAKRYGERAALLMMDVDSFKEINDTYGHRVGDDALRAIGHMLLKGVRVMDSVARIGGDEFAVILPYADRATAEAVADRLRRSISTECTLSVGGQGNVPLSISIGIAEIDKARADEEAALQAADRAMYEQKHAASPGA